MASPAVAAQARVTKCQFATGILDKRPADKITAANRNVLTYFYVEITGDADFWRPQAAGGVGQIVHKWSRRLTEWSDFDLDADFSLTVPPGPLGDEAERERLQAAAQRDGNSTYATFTNLQQSLAPGYWMVATLLGSKDGPPLKMTGCVNTLEVK